MTRRRALGLGLGGLAWGLARRRALGASSAGPRRSGAAPARAEACVFLFLRGGPSQLETFDPRPEHANGGGTRAIPTTVTGLRVAEHLPRMARRMDRVALLRAMTGRERNHERAEHLLHAGHLPAAGTVYPGLGAWLAGDHGGPLPGHVAVAGAGHPAGPLGAAAGPFRVRDPRRPIPYLRPPRGLAPRRFEARVAAWRAREEAFARRLPGAGLDQRRAVWEQALSLMEAPELRVFDLSRESARTRARYGEGRFGQGCLLARRLVGAGVPFVEVELAGWDTHRDNFTRTPKLARELDQGFAALLDDLRADGHLDRTLVVCAGEFGRTPRINDKGGRDHHSELFSAVVAGGGVRGGQVIGAGSDDGMTVRERPVTVPDLLRALALRLGLNPDEETHSRAGRPLPMIDPGTPVPELLG